MKSIHSETAKAIRQELKKKYPGIKFSVRSKSYTGGTSVHIEWTGGPLKDDIYKDTQKYQYGHFDGMTDMYEGSNRRDDLPQVKFILAHRRSE